MSPWVAARRGLVALIPLILAPSLAQQAQTAKVREYPLPEGSRPHDVAPAPDGSVWYTAQAAGALGRLDPQDGTVHEIPLGEGSRPHGVIVGPDGHPWITDGGLNAIVMVNAQTEEVSVYRLPEQWPNANLNTAVFDAEGTLWFTGQTGTYGRLDPRDGTMELWPAPGGRGPYGITVTPDGAVYYASLAGSHIARIDTRTGEATVLQPPTPNQGARRVWSDSAGNIWVAEWNAGAVARYDPSSDTWREWPLPGEDPRAYAVYVDENDLVWLTDFGNDTIWRFDPQSESFESFDPPSHDTEIRQLLGRPGEVWGAGSAVDTLVVVRHSPGTQE